MHPLRMGSLAAAAAIVPILAAAGTAAVMDDAAPALAIPTARGSEIFLVAAPDAPTSTASRLNSDLADKQGAIPAPTPGYALTSTIIVRTHAPNIAPAVPGAAAPAGAAAQPAVSAHPAVPGYWLVTMPTVREAAAATLGLRADPAVAEAYLDVSVPQPLRNPPSDPGYINQWHLRNTQTPFNDLHVEPVWKMPFTGAGVTVGIIEDGFTTTHPDLAANYNAAASQTGAAATSHGTSVAGLVAAAAGNGIGGAGVAYGARVAKLYRGSATANADAFGFRNDLNFIKSNSWGPPDNGILAFITPLERSALAQSVANGRAGLGTVHIWAAGNGGTSDRVDYDPYANSRFVIAVGSTDDDDARAYYNETGSSMFVVTPSSGDFSGDRGIYTTSGSQFYTASFGGTSASAPMAAGVVALMLEARPQLTWRDVRHILARTAVQCDPAAPGWETNAAGHLISYDYGFGAIDAAAAVALAQTWPLIAPAASATTGVLAVGAPIPGLGPAGITRTAEIGTNLRIETVEIEFTAAHPYIGDLRVELTAPSGTTSLLALPRSDPTDNYAGYIFSSVRHWDERSAGTWTLRVTDEAANDDGTWSSWRLTIHGTPACATDWNEDNAVNSTDVSAFLADWIASVTGATLDADFNTDGSVNSTDISAFLTGWIAAVSGGC